MTYEIIKALHIISVVAWFAGLFYLPRLFVYHVNAEAAARPMLETMEYKLYRYIMNPAMVATWVFGIWMLVLIPEWLTGQGWLHAKIFLVILLTGFHHSLNAYRKKLAAGESTKNDKFFRIINEIPTATLIFVVFLVVLKPF